MARVALPLRVAAAIGTLTLLVAGCSKHEPVGGFYGYRWGTPVDSILADSARFATSLSEPGFSLQREGGGLHLWHVQFGMGYAEVRFDFDAQGGLWHGAVRVEGGTATADSIRDAWHERHGRESSTGRIDTDSGYTTFWSTGSTVDRHYFSPAWASAQPRPVRALDLFYGGCLAGCPLYSVRLLGDGKALLHALREVDPLGCYVGTWKAQAMPALTDLANDAGVRALESYYSPSPERGLASRGMTVHFQDGRNLTAESVKQCGPPALEHLVSVLDSVAAAVVWERPVVLWDTLDLNAQRWIDLDSLERLTAR